MTKPLLDESDDDGIEAAFDAAFEQGTLVSHLTPERQKELQAAARATLNPAKKLISTRLAERDLIRLKAKAMEQGIPYQSLLASIVHRYVEGDLVDKS